MRHKLEIFSIVSNIFASTALNPKIERFPVLLHEHYPKKNYFCKKFNVLKNWEVKKSIDAKTVRIALKQKSFRCCLKIFFDKVC